MEVLYSGGSFCSESTLKRLVLVANRIAFMDHPSITFSDWGTVGNDSPIRRFDTSNLPVQITAHRPPSGPVTDLYLKFLESDLSNPTFTHLFLDGLKRDEFAWKFLQPEGKYGDASGKEIRTAIVTDAALLSQNLKMPTASGMAHRISTSEERRETLQVLLAETSFRISSSMIISGKTGFFPVTDDSHFSKLLFSRLNNFSNKASTAPFSPHFALAIFSSVIPNELLEKIDMDAICEYRENSKREYEHWTTTINALLAKLDGVNPLNAENEIQRLVVTDIRPKIADYYRSLEAIRDKQFGELIKQVVTWEFPTLSIAQMAGASWSGMAAAFATALIPAAAPHVVDYFVNSRDVKRKNSISYLIGIQERAR
jgi:hypothetical protein